MANVNFLTGSAASYAALATKVSTDFYLLSDTGDLYIGEKKVTNAADLASAVARVAQNESDITDINTTLTKLENTESTSGSIRAIIKSYFDAYRAVDLIYKDEEGTVGEEGYKAAVTVKKALDDLNAAIGSGGSVTGQITDAIEALDATVSQAAGSDGLALSVTQTDGVITGVTGSIAANTYDAYGAASTVQSTITGASTDGADALTLNGLSAKAAAAQDAADAAQSDVDDLEALVGTGFGTKEVGGETVNKTVKEYIDEAQATATYDDTALAARVTANEGAITLLNKTDGTVGSVKKTVDDAIAAVVANAPSDFDTLKEMSDWISGHENDASAMNSAISANTTAIGSASVAGQGEAGDPDYVAPVAATGLHKKIEDETARATAAEDALDGRVDTLEAAIGAGGSVQDAIDDAIEALDTASDVVVASATDGVVTISGSVKEVDGVIAKGTASDIVLAKLATSGSAVDVSLVDAGNNFTATSVEGALSEIATKLTWQSF